MTDTQANRWLAMNGPYGDKIRAVTDLTWDESLGQPCQGHLRFVATTDDLDPSEIIGKALPIRIGKDESAVHRHGYVTALRCGNPVVGGYAYEAELTSWLGLLVQSGGQKIFQNASVIDIAQTIIGDRGFDGQFESRVTRVCPPRPYCVQFGESDFAFLDRLFAEEGLYYFCEYSDHGHVVVLADDVSAHTNADGLATLKFMPGDRPGPSASLHDVQTGNAFATSARVLRDYDFQQPRVDLTVRQPGVDEPTEDWTLYEFPGRYFDQTNGEYYAQVRTQAAQAARQSIAATTRSAGLSCGCSFTLQSHPRDDLNVDYIVRRSTLTASQAAPEPGVSPIADQNVSVQLQPAAQPYRSPEIKRPPAMVGPQIATVVGKDGEEIWTDPYGRVKVKFAWDLDDVSDETSSCWLRVVQPWTGKGFGAVSLPRIGEEVLVDFIDGDPDRPIVTGRVFNADRMPPDELADAQAKTIFRTRSTKQGDADAFHELSFDDTKDAEKVYFHSERDFERIVENNDTLKVGFEKQTDGDQSIEVYNNQTVKVGVGSGAGTQDVEIGAGRTTTIDSGDDQLTVADGALTIEASKSITLKCGQSSIEITPSGITIRSDQIDVKGLAQANVAAPEITIKSDAELQLSAGAQATLKAGGPAAIQGAIVQIN